MWVFFDFCQQIIITEKFTSGELCEFTKTKKNNKQTVIIAMWQK